MLQRGWKRAWCVGFCCGWLFALALGVNPQRAEAQKVRGLTTNPLLRQGLGLYNEQKYPQAIVIFNQVLNWAGSTQEHKIEALKYLAFIQMVLGNGAKARNHFLTILKTDPKFDLDSAWYSPKFVEFFRPIRKDFLASRRVQIKADNPEELSIKKKLILRFQVKDNQQRMLKFVIWYRIQGNERYYERELQDEKGMLKKAGKLKGPVGYQFSYPVPQGLGGNREGAFMFQYYAHAIGAGDQVVATLGTSKRPLQIKRTFPFEDRPKPPPSASTPFYKTWWFWTIVGVGVVGGASAGIAAAVLSQPPPLPANGTAIITIVRN